MLKRYSPFVLFLLFLSCISGYLMSKPSLVGRIGINFFYKEYKFLRVWWQGASVVFVVLFVLFLLQAIVHHRLQKRKANLVFVVLLLLALTGFYLTWQDFHETATHRWLKERFHIGAYLFWLGWIVSNLFFLFQKPKPLPTTT